MGPARVRAQRAPAGAGRVDHELPATDQHDGRGGLTRRSEPTADAAALVAEFARGYPFDLDEFQRRGCLALARGAGTLVAAPTGAGKTVVGEFAVWLARRAGAKAFYTTPLKALSNQKYGDFVARHGAAAVGLLTGDNSINGEAPVVVMTTEVLRNMLYERSATLGRLGFVVLDEVHYLQDRVRGAVWEEVLINLGPEVRTASLSATVSNAEEFGEWLTATRGRTEVVISDERPVPLDNEYLVGRELYPLLLGSTPEQARPAGRPTPGGGDGPRINPALVRRLEPGPRPGRGGYRRRGGARSTWVPSRVEVVDRLEVAGLLPAIYFIFSRAGCNQAVAQCLAANVRLTTVQERDEIRRQLELLVAPLDDADLGAVGYGEFAEALGRGVASHHAGMLPLFREAVEELFGQGLVRAVFATETLSLGINMPARTVVIERLLKWQGERHELLTPGEYTQLTGRAGRRGIDVQGTAVVLHQPFVPIERVAGLASARLYPLTSSFRPSYNMAVNLAANYAYPEAVRLLGSSFAQFLADRTAHATERAVARNAEFLAGYLQSARCERGDVTEYAALRTAVLARERELEAVDRSRRSAESAEALRALTPGTVVQMPGGRRRGLAVVLGNAGGRPDSAGVLVLTEDQRVRRIAVRDLDGAPVPVGRVRLPRTLSPKSPRFKARVAEELAGLPAPPPPGRSRRRSAVADDPELARLRAALRGHPVHACPDRADHERWLQRHAELAQQDVRLRARLHRRSGSLVRAFDQVLEQLRRFGYLEGMRLTAKGDVLRRVYAESDLLVAEALDRGTWSGLDPAELAGCVSAVVFEPRGPDPAPAPPPPTAAARAAHAELERLAEELRAAEQATGLDLTRPPDPGFAEVAWRWARGAPLDLVLEEELGAGDFVRTTKQLIDLLRQVATVAPDEALASTARRAIAASHRGVVAASSLQ